MANLEDILNEKLDIRDVKDKLDSFWYKIRLMSKKSLEDFPGWRTNEDWVMKHIKNGVTIKVIDKSLSDYGKKYIIEWDGKKGEPLKDPKQWIYVKNPETGKRALFIPVKLPKVKVLG